MVTTLPAPTTVLSPMVTPGSTMTPAPQPAVAANADRHVVLIVPLPQRAEQGMPCRGKDHVGRKHGVVPHIDVGVVHQGQVEVGVDVAAEVDVTAPKVGMQGWLDVAALADLGKHFPQQGGTPGKLAGTGLVEVVEFFQAGGLLPDDVGIVREIQVPAVHLFFFGHGPILLKCRRGSRAVMVLL